MPTPTMSDEELDALFQRGAAAYPDEMPAAAWARMETKLDEAARTQHLRRKVGRFFVGELLLIALLLWQVARIATPAASLKSGHSPSAAFRAGARTTAASTRATPTDFVTNAGLRHRDTAPALHSNTTPGPLATTAGAPTAYAAATSVASAAPGRPLTAKLPLSSLAAPATPAALESTSRPARPAVVASLAALAPARAAKHQSVSAARAVLAKNPGTKEKPVAMLAEKKTRRKRPRPASQVLASANGQAARTQSASARASDLARAAAAEQTASVGLGEPIDSLAGRVAFLPIAGYPLPELSRPLAVQQPAADTTLPRHRAPRPPYRVLVGLLAGPSFSGVRTAQTAQLGVDYGLTLEYRFGPRWRVRAGLLSSQKRYLAASTDYEAPAAWQWFAGTYDLQANCRITEIPLDLRYDVLSRPTYTVFTSLGVNSLLMRNERYSYDWTANGQTFTKSAEVRKGSNHFLSVLNVSVGFEKPLGQRWSAQVEPFWQFPLGGVGAGKVRLTSAGASFSLKFGLLK
jgi:hypothetical protein